MHFAMAGSLNILRFGFHLPSQNDRDQGKIEKQEKEAHSPAFPGKEDLKDWIIKKRGDNKQGGCFQKPRIEERDKQKEKINMIPGEGTQEQEVDHDLAKARLPEGLSAEEENENQGRKGCEQHKGQSRKISEGNGLDP